jgi:hypothetical protein
MKKMIFLFVACFIAIVSFSQKQQFEEPKQDSKFDSLKVKIGGGFGLQYQAIKCTADSPLVPLGNGINLPEANMNINATLAKGIKVNLEVYLSAKHHNESWVKGGYLLVDDLSSVIKNDVIDNIMKKVTFKVGVMEVNYGDQHFRRTDGGNVIRNPFVGNLIMDPFETASAFEINLRPGNGIVAMVGATNGIVNQSITSWNSSAKKFFPYNIGDEMAYYLKVGYDKQFNKDFRFRGTFSFYTQDYSHQGCLYSGDRTGSRYYLVMLKRALPPGTATDVSITANAFTGNWGPGSIHNITAGLINIFAKYKGIELFGHFDQAVGITSYVPKTTSGMPYKFNQMAVELLYRFGKEEQFYVGGRYNTVQGKFDQDKTYYPTSTYTAAANATTGPNVPAPDQSIDRISGILGWYLNKYTVLKVEYVDQKYNNFNSKYWGTNFGAKAGFSGVMVEAGITF